MKFGWEDIYIKHIPGGVNIATWRAKVIGGWVVNTVVSGAGELSISAVFVPDETHSWEIEKI